MQIIKNDKRDSNKEFVERFESLQSILFEAKSYLQDAFENGATQDLVIKLKLKLLNVNVFFIRFPNK